MTIGKRIALLRKQAGLTQDALARELGVSPQAVSKWENDLSCPDILLLPRLAKKLRVTTDQLLGADTDDDTDADSDSDGNSSAGSESLPDEDTPSDAPSGPEPDREPVGDPLGIHVESADGSNFNVHIDPPRGVGVAVALWIILTGVLMLAGPLFELPSVGFWMALLISGCVVFSLRSMRRGIHFFNTMFLLLGLFTAASCLSVTGFHLDWTLLWPGIIVLMGLFLLVEQLRKKHRRGRVLHFTGPDSAVSSSITLEDGYLAYHNSFGEDHYRVATPLLTGGEINVSFGEHTLDFSGVEAVAENCHLEVNSSFGEICLMIPKRYRADVRLSKSFAEAEMDGSPDSNPQGVIFIEANLSFGELEIRYV